ncbi:MAG: hypothetical protein MR793_01675 [Bacteroidales bacterium]|nr:hypothetical protein [Bacteroidales bacterium]
MENHKEMTAQESLKIIAETLDGSRREIVRSTGKYFIVWGLLLTAFSVLIFILWKTSGKSAWNNLWFAMPLAGYPLSAWLKSRESGQHAENFISRTNGDIWKSFFIIACSAAAFSVLAALPGKNGIASLTLLANLTALIIVLFGLAETVSGFVLKNLSIKIAGWITGIGGLAIYHFIGPVEEQMLIFTFAGVVLAATGLIVKHQYR